MITFGIDPGQTGAIAVFLHADIIAVYDMPVIGKRVDRHGITTIVGSQYLGDRRIVLEDVSTRPGLSATAVLTTGINWGIVYACVALWPTHVVTPQKWQPAIGCPKGLDRDARKTWCRQRATQLWPDFADRFAAKSADGRADAALMAYAHILGATKAAAA